MTHQLWTTIPKIDAANEMLKLPLAGDTADAVRMSASLVHGQVDNGLSAVKTDILRFIQDDEHRSAAASVASSLPTPAPISLPSLSKGGKNKNIVDDDEDDHAKLTQVEKLAERIFVSLLARTIPVENPALHAMELAEKFFEMLSQREHVR